MNRDVTKPDGTESSADPYDLPEETLRARRNAKWNLYGPDVLPAFVAEMDFAIAGPIQAAIERNTAFGDYGYPLRRGGKPETIVAKLFAERMKAKFGWEAAPDLAYVITDLVQGTFAAITAFSDPGDGVILHVPAYPPFREAIAGTHRALIPLTMRDDGHRFRFDLDEISAAVDERTRIILLCNPQNPTGRVFTREELMQLARFAIARDLIVISDEIHCDLVYPGRHHTPFAALGPEVAERTVTLGSATKGFNIPGLRCAVMQFGTAELRDRFARRIHYRVLGSNSAIGVDATIAAWEEGEAWLTATMRHLHKARDHVMARLRAETPEIRVHAPEATYLAWLDCSALQLNGSAYQFFLDHARIGFSPGESFDPACKDFVRLNFATSIARIDAIIDRMIGALRRR